jgi:hypothetical protein
VNSRVLPFLALTVAILNIGFTTHPSGAASDSQWSTPLLVNPHGSHANQVTYSVSCPSNDFCAIADGNGDVTLRRHGSWLPGLPVNAGGSFDSISCPTATHCVAIGGAGNAVTFNGRDWSSARRIGPDVSYHVSCPTVQFCAAVGASGTPTGFSTIVLLHGRVWSSRRIPTTNWQTDRLMDVSCTTQDFCAAVNLNGKILTFKGAKWSTSSAYGHKGLISVSCVSGTFCLAVGDAGQFTTYDGTRWTSPHSIPLFGSAFAYSVSCASPAYCVVLGINGYSVSWKSGRWSAPERVFTGGASAGVSVSCPPSGACVAVNDKGLGSYN